MTCEGVMFTHPVGCSRLLSAVNDLATTFFPKKRIVSSTSAQSTATMKYWMKKKKTNATFGIDKGELVQVPLLQIHGEDGSQL